MQWITVSWCGVDVLNTMKNYLADASGVGPVLLWWRADVPLGPAGCLARKQAQGTLVQSFAFTDPIRSHLRKTKVSETETSKRLLIGLACTKDLACAARGSLTFGFTSQTHTFTSDKTSGTQRLMSKMSANNSSWCLTYPFQLSVATIYCFTC